MKLKDEANFTIPEKCQFPFVQGKDISSPVEDLTSSLVDRECLKCEEGWFFQHQMLPQSLPFHPGEGEIDSLEDIHTFGSSFPKDLKAVGLGSNRSHHALLHLFNLFVRENLDHLGEVLRGGFFQC